MSEHTITLSNDNFDEEVIKSEKVVLVDLWAPWCGPCKMIGPVVEQVAEEYKDKIKVGKLNVDDNQAIAGQYNVSSIPTLLLFKGGKVVSSHVGVMFKPAMFEMIDKALEG
jgi:thioredoxin 1